MARPFLVSAAAAAALGLAAAALINRQAAAKAERDHPPLGRHLDIDGVRLHYVERGSGTPLVLLHGNGSMVEDFESSGLIAAAAERYRVIAFDRPGYGHSNRPRDRYWSAEAQADLIRKAMAALGAEPAVVLGHSWGAAVALTLALRHPASVQGLVLASGYYYPSPRPDAVIVSAPAVPVLGDLLRVTLAPFIGRALWPALMRKIFGPAEVPAKFARGFPRDMALRPSQLRASAAEAGQLMPHALRESLRGRVLRMPMTILAGRDDRLIDIDAQSARLHREIPHSTFRSVPGAGHMVHQTATDEVLAAIDATAARAGSTPRITDPVRPAAVPAG